MTDQKKHTPKKKRYWFGFIHIQGVGIVSGEVRDDHLKKFKDQFAKGCKASGLADVDQKKLNLEYYIRDRDIIGEAREKALKQQRAKLGLK